LAGEEEQAELTEFWVSKAALPRREKKELDAAAVAAELVVKFPMRIAI